MSAGGRARQIAGRSLLVAASAAALLFSGASTTPAEVTDSQPPGASIAADQFLWSGDGSTLLALDLDESGALLAAYAFDGVTAETRWELSGERLAPLRTAASAGRIDNAVPAPDGGRMLFGAGDQWWSWSPADGALAPIAELADAREPRFAPDGARLAFVRNGDLWIFEIADRRARPVTTDGLLTRDGELPPAVATRAGSAIPRPFDWASDSRQLAFYRWDAAGTIRLAVVGLLDDEVRAIDLESDGAGLPVGWTWRFDARALAVQWIPAGDSRLDLRLCHPDRLYCRPLASRPWSADRPLRDDFRFLEDGFLWGSGEAGVETLAFFDPLGRERRRLTDPPAVRVEIAALLEPSREIAVAVERPNESGFVHLLLVDLRSGRLQEIARAPGQVQALISGELRSWIRPGKDAEGRFSGHLLERLDGTLLRTFD